MVVILGNFLTGRTPARPSTGPSATNSGGGASLYANRAETRRTRCPVGRRSGPRDNRPRPVVVDRNPHKTPREFESLRTRFPSAAHLASWAGTSPGTRIRGPDPLDHDEPPATPTSGARYRSPLCPRSDLDTPLTAPPGEIARLWTGAVMAAAVCGSSSKSSRSASA